MIHGFSDHINVYNPFFPKLAERGIEVIGWDQRGWGRSPKTKKEYGLTGNTERVIADIIALLKEQRDDVPVSLSSSIFPCHCSIITAADMSNSSSSSLATPWEAASSSP